MPSSIINSDDGLVSGTSGIKTTGGDDGVLVFQSKGTETARINTDKQIVAAAGTASLPIYSTTGDLNTGIFFPAADTIAFAEGGAEAMRIDSSGNLLFNSGYGSVATAYGCRAWVNFDGTGTPAIREDGNVSSITDNGTGDYTVNFTSNMPDVNYCSLATGTGQVGVSIDGYANIRDPGTEKKVGSVRVQQVANPSAGTPYDTPNMNVAIFR